jgi:hypothetical protein
MTEQNDLNFTNEEKSKEKFREILPTVNYLISTNLNFMKDNDKKIDAKLYLLKNKVNQKIQKFCSESFNYLNSQGKIIIPNQSIDGVSSDTIQIVFYYKIKFRKFKLILKNFLKIYH